MSRRLNLKWILPDGLGEFARPLDRHIPDLNDRMNLVIDLAAAMSQTAPAAPLVLLYSRGKAVC